MHFWRLGKPDFDSDYQSQYVNGTLRHQYGLPGIKCHTCRQTWSSVRVLPYQCPTSMRDRVGINERWPIRPEEHRLLRADLAEALVADGQNVTAEMLRPGDELQPGTLCVPSRPEADFLWSSLGSVVVSLRVRNELAGAVGDEVSFVPVRFGRVGELSSQLVAPVPNSGEPEDLVEEVPLLTSHDDIPEYFEAIVTAESGPPHGIHIRGTCEDCGRVDADKRDRDLRVHPDMWRGHNIFLLSTTLHVVVTDTIREMLQAMNPTNVVFSPAGVEDAGEQVSM